MKNHLQKNNDKTNRFRKTFLKTFFIVTLIVASITNAATINVSTVAALNTAVTNSVAGDIIVLADGNYGNSTITIAAGKNNIIVRAATPGGVIFNGTGTNIVSIDGNNVTFSGFQFINGVQTTDVITVKGDYVILTQLNFSHYSAQKYINLRGQYDEITYCNFEDKPITSVIGNLIHIYSRADSTPNYSKIRYCSFQNMPGAGGDNGNECIRITNANPIVYIARVIVEFCYFNNTGLGDSEVISVKSYENVLRYNTMINNQKGNFCWRYGSNNVAYGNFFINSGGFRFKEANNIHCYNNYFENCGDGSLSAPIKYVASAGFLSNLNIVHNTFVGGTPIEFDTAGTNNVWANNIFSKTTGNIFSGPVASNTFAGNIYSGTLGVTIASGMTNVDPQLVTNSEGYYGLSATSPGIDVASASYPAILDIASIDDDPTLTLDISGQARPVSAILKDVGCDEYTSGATTNHPLALTEVGPIYLGGPGGKLNQTITFNTLPAKVVGDADFSAGATASSGLTVSYVSSNTAVATIVGGNIHIVGAGTATITASQAGDAAYNAATAVVKLLTVTTLKIDQSITFAALSPKVFGDADFSPGATASSGLTVSYVSSNTAVATIVSGNIQIVGAGTATITASQSGDASYNAATNVPQTLTVNMANQTITFNALPAKVVGAADFSPGATASSGLTVSYVSSNTAVATIVSGNIHIVGAGTSTITASQAGNINYNAATNVTQTITVTAPVVTNYAPTSSTILFGSANSGSVSKLALNDNTNILVINSTTSGTRVLDWYSSVAISQTPSSVTKLTISYDGKYSKSRTQVLYLYNWSTSAWSQIDSRTVSTSDVLVTNVQTSPINFISSTGEIRLRVYTTGGNNTYTCSGDWVQFTVETSSGLRLKPGVVKNTSSSEKVTGFKVFPNPIFDTAEFEYTILEEGKVQLNLYNSNGQMIKTFINNETHKPGNYIKTIDCSGLRSGVYIAQLKYGNAISTIKVIVRN
jgi:siroheme synthase